jgi:hypothetical protein
MKQEPHIQRAFTVNADEQAIRTRLLEGMKMSGFKLASEDDSELKFKRGSHFASEPNSQIYVTIRFDPVKRNHLIAFLKAFVLVQMFWVCKGGRELTSITIQFCLSSSKLLLAVIRRI